MILYSLIPALIVLTLLYFFRRWPICRIITVVLWLGWVYSLTGIFYFGNSRGLHGANPYSTKTEAGLAYLEGASAAWDRDGLVIAHLFVALCVLAVPLLAYDVQQIWARRKATRSEST